MRIFSSPDPLPAAHRGAVMCLGNFDGFHRGHQAVFHTADRIAAETGAPLGALTTEPHPREFFRPDGPPFRLSSFRTKAHLFETFGLDLCAVLTFDADLAATEAVDFVRDILVRRLGVGHIVVGYDYHFGRGREGTTDLLLEEGRDAGFGLTVVPPKGEAEGVYSSSAIRDAIRAGRMFEAAQELGHWWMVEGIVAPGRKLGQTLGFPTANVPLEGYVQPAHAIYAVRVMIEGEPRPRPAVASFGTRPTVEEEGQPLLEVLLLDGEHELYGKHLWVEFVEFLRAEARFEDLEVLKTRMNQDCEAARRILSDSAYARDRFALVPRGQ